MYPMTITLTIQNPAQFVALAAAISGGPAVIQGASTPLTELYPAKQEPKAEKKSSTKPSSVATAAEPAASTVESTTEAEPAGIVETQEPATSVVIDYATVSKAITDSVKPKGRDAVVATLNSFGAAKGPDLKPEQYADFIAALGALPDLGA